MKFQYLRVYQKHELALKRIFLAAKRIFLAPKRIFLAV